MAWSSKSSVSALTNINDGTEQYHSAVTLNPGETAHCQVEIDNLSGTVTNGIIVSVYTTLDASTETWSDQAIQSWVVTPDVVTSYYFPVIVSGVYKFRIGLIAAAATDDYDSDMWYRTNGIDA